MNLKKRYPISICSLLLGLLINAVAFAQDQRSPTGSLSGSEIQQRWVSALGGYERLAAAKTIHLHATLDYGGMKGTFDRWTTSEGQLREVVDVPGAFHQESVLQGDQGWTLEPSGKVHALSDGDLEELVTDAYESSASFLLHGRMQGQSEFLGTDDTHQFFVWKLQPSGGKPLTIFIDTKTFLPVREETRQGPSKVTTVFSGWRTMHGLQIPGTIFQSNGDPQSDTKFSVEQLDINPAVDVSFFYKPRETAAEVKYAGPNKSLHVPVDVAGNRVFVKARVNGSEPAWFMLDTGAETSVITREFATKLGLRSQGAMSTIGSGGSANMSLLKDVVFGLPGVDVPSKTVAVLDFSQLLPSLGHDMAGLLGYDVISRFVLRIDYQNEIIGLSDPNSFKYSGTGIEIPLGFTGNYPQIAVKIVLTGRSPIETMAIIDTGANNLLLTTQFVELHKVLSAVGKTVPKPTLGVGGGSDAVQGRISAIQIGPYTLKEPVALLMQGENGGMSNSSFGANVGAAILSRFVSTFDYERRQLFLEPSSNFTAPFPVDGSGLQLLHEGKDFKTIRVDGVQSDSPAAAAGIQKGDIITEIDGRSASSLNLDQIEQLLEDNGRSYRLTLQRSGKSIDAILQIMSPF
jgi:predicted aspartyl protease